MLGSFLPELSWSFSRNQSTQVEGADAVMQSSIERLLLDGWETTEATRRPYATRVRRGLRFTSASNC